MEENADDSVVPEENEPTLPSSVLNVIEKLKQLSDPSVVSLACFIVLGNYRYLFMVKDSDQKIDNN
jgi:hypothetical protein